MSKRLLVLALLVATTATVFGFRRVVVTEDAYKEW